jgi:TPR repeat protein
MRRVIATILVPWMLLVGAPGLANAGPFDDGLAAFNRADYAMALRLWEPLAKQGNSIAQGNLGVMYLNGHGVPQNYAEAAKWFRLAANQGHAGAQSMLGLLYVQGQGVPQNYAMAHMWFNLASAAGEELASTNRDRIASKMTASQIAEAQKLAAEWKPK